MKKYLLLLLLCMVVVSAAQAADQAVSLGQLYKQEIEMTRAALEAQRKSLIAGEMMPRKKQQRFGQYIMIIVYRCARSMTGRLMYLPIMLRPIAIMMSVTGRLGACLNAT